MSEIDAAEAKTHMLRLLERVQAGERFVITWHDRPIAELTPFRGVDRDRVRTAIDSLREFRQSHSLGGLAIRELIEEGRRH